MPIEIRELHIKVKVEESPSDVQQANDMDRLRASILNACKAEIKRQLRNKNDR